MTTSIRQTYNENGWDLILRPQRAWWDLQLNELWHYRDLIWLFVWRDFVASYKQTILGPLWFFIQPIVGSVIFTIIFGQIAQLPTEGLPDFIYYMSGNVIWGYFSQSLSNTSDSLAANAGLFGKVYFPRLSVPISKLISNLISFSIQFFAFLCFLVYFWKSGSNIHPNLGVLLLPLLLLIMAGMGLGIGLIFSSLTARYRDLKRLVGTGVTLWMYVTPVVYPVSSVPAYLQPLVQANPLTPIVLTFRYTFLGVGTFDPLSLVYSFGLMLIVLLIGLILFNKAEATFLDTV